MNINPEITASSDLSLFQETQEAVFNTRQARLDDVEALVSIDIDAFSSVYDEYEIEEHELREDLEEKFKVRLSKIDLDWVRVAEMNGEICGFIMTCPTSKKPEDFISWEDTTDDGTLEELYDPNGPNLYVVSLTMPRPEGGETPKNMIIGDHIGKMVEGRYELAYFESRLPGLRDWVDERCSSKSIDRSSLEDEELFELAKEYAETRVLINGRQELIDPHLRMYEKLGCKFIKVAPDAYRDGPSLNFGMVTVLENPLPQFVKGSRILSSLAGTAIRKVAKSNKLAKRLLEDEETAPQTMLNELPDTYTQEAGTWDKLKNFVKRKKVALAVGATALSAGVTLTNNPWSELTHDVISAAPWVGAGVATSEGLFIAGAVMMAGAVGDKIGNPLTVKERIPEIASKADGSKLFKAGFWVNTVGALGTAGVVTAGVALKMPVESYPMASLAFVDIGLTVAVRTAIYSGVKNQSAINQNLTENKQPLE